MAGGRGGSHEAPCDDHSILAAAVRAVVAVFTVDALAGVLAMSREKLKIGFCTDANGEMQWVVWFEDSKLCELTFIELVELAANATSALRWQLEKARKPGG